MNLQICTESKGLGLMGGGFIHTKLKKIQMNLHKLIARSGTDKKT